MSINPTPATEKSAADIVKAKAFEFNSNANSDGGTSPLNSRRGSAPSAFGRRLPPRPKPTRELSSSLMTNLDCSREGLRECIGRRHSSLLPKEIEFLRDLLEDGNEEQLTMVREKLSDRSLFFDRGVESSEKSSVGTGSDESTPRRPSDKVEEYRQSRRQSEWHGKMWKAHEENLAATTQGTRMRSMRRSSNKTSVSSSTSSNKFSTKQPSTQLFVPNNSSASRDIPSTAASLLHRSLDGSRGSSLLPSNPKRMVFRRASNRTHLGEGIEVLTSSMIGGGSDVAAISTVGSFDDGSADSSVGKGSQATDTTFHESGSTFDDFPSVDDTYRLELRKVPSHLRETDDSAPTNNILSVKRLDSDSWEDDNTEGHYDPWNILKDEYAVEYLGGDTLPFRILGTSVDDVDATPHVLSPPLMENLQNFFPYTISEENFWMRYSLVKHGASIPSLLPHIRGARYTVVAVETTDGEVFGSFTGTAWKNNGHKYFGSGEAFLWRMRQSRNTPCFSIIDQAHIESELDVYPWTGDNDCVQLCSNNTIAVGGGSLDGDEGKEYGFGFALDYDLLHGTTNHCATFGSPPLSKIHKDGSPFEIVNVEVWTTTPCYTLDDAERLQLGKLFLERHATV